MDDVLIAKAANLSDCLKRITEEYGNRSDLYDNRTKQDAIILNLLRACETVIDMANHIVRNKKLGLPKVTRDSFDLLKTAGYISPELSLFLRNMVGFRNITIHEYETINLDIVKDILDNHLDDLKEFSQLVLNIR